MLFVAVILNFLLWISQATSIIISPCKVRNMVTQPIYGTSLKTKGLVHIIQIPPVFTQSVMVGICENRNQNISTGPIPGEFYVCQQRYSAVEVYIADTSTSVPDPYHHTSASDKLNNPKYIRESVIIESGCDFTFNLLPFLTQGQNSPQDSSQVPPQQKIFLKSPYHPSIPTNPSGLRQPTASYTNSQVQSQYHQDSTTSGVGVGYGGSSATSRLHSALLLHALGRAESKEEDELKLLEEEETEKEELLEEQESAAE